jgi:uncharacterized small protein (DUF1192 family)
MGYSDDGPDEYVTPMGREWRALAERYSSERDLALGQVADLQARIGSVWEVEVARLRYEMERALSASDEGGSDLDAVRSMVDILEAALNEKTPTQ